MADTTAPSSVHGVTPVLVALGLVVVASVAAAAALGLRQASPEGLEPDQNRIVTTAAAVVTPETNVQVSVQLGDATSLRAPQWEGLVTAVSVAPGQTLDEGDVVVKVGQLNRIAVSTDEPFFRQLASGDTGLDVEQLRAVLIRLGFLDPELTTGRYDVAVGRAVAQLRFSLGGPEPRNNATSSFDPAWLVHLGPGGSLDGVDIASVALRVGQPAPAAGTEIVTFVAPIETVTVADVTAGTIGVNPVQTIEIGGVRTGLDGNRAEVTPAIADAVAALLRQEEAAPSDQSDGADQPAVPIEVPATLATTWPTDVVQIPLTAVVTRTDGSSCVVAFSSTGPSPFVVSVVGSATGSATALVSGLAEGTDVVANPAWSGDDRVCLNRASG